MRRIAATLVCAVLLTACGEQNEPSADVTSPSGPIVEYEAVVDPETGTIELPVDQFYVFGESEEHALLVDADDVIQADCLSDNGTPTQPRTIHQDTWSNRYYGVWIMSEVERFGYALPQTPEEVELTEQNTDSAAVPSEADLAAANSCREERAPQFARLQIDEDVYVPFTVPFDAGFETAEGQALLKEWYECLSANGVKPPSNIDNGFLPPEASVEVTEQNIRIAVTDVQCRTDIDFVRRIADIDADIQSEFIAEHEAELMAQRAEYDEALNYARGLLNGTIDPDAVPGD